MLYNYIGYAEDKISFKILINLKKIHVVAQYHCYQRCYYSTLKMNIKRYLAKVNIS